uniref:Uncharacterized protein n=1 Tax=Chromera velia CCMP2878 TaxID=1169474 RepID=A0A0G4IFS2_9ALVE|eukprot:Cvel_14063.t1-p1 / transcript=Cvel_14063.t1 / gene=Cvel_14063 / organism=Chromera_velia_CCMP2878 / gene_product=hypothetical protein / transcript_product=hypothetical protein / location=Cvel_scaffold986:51885-59003(-) / protein_length=1626 / sequence_SO=supercontig / SO=protein_coding / is_pseudo=false
MRTSLHANRVEDRELLCTIAVQIVKADKPEELEALLKAKRFKLHWKIPKTAHGVSQDQRDASSDENPSRHLTDTAIEHRALQCLTVLADWQSPLGRAGYKALIKSFSQLPESGVLPTLRVLLETKQVNPNPVGVSWFLRSITTGRYQVAALLLDHGTSVDVWETCEFNGRSEKGCTPLHALLEQYALQEVSDPPEDLMRRVVVEARDCDCLDWIAKLKGNARRGVREEVGSPLLFAARRFSVKSKLSSWEIRFLEALAEAGADVGATDDTGGLTAFHWLCRIRWREQNREDTAAEETETERLHPVLERFIASSKFLPLNSGPRVPGFEGARFTPVIAAAEQGDWELVRVLVERGSSVDMGRTETESKETLLHLAVTRTENLFNPRPLAPLSLLHVFLQASKDANPRTESYQAGDHILKGSSNSVLSSDGEATPVEEDRVRETSQRNVTQQLTSISLTPFGAALSSPASLDLSVVQALACVEKIDSSQVAFGQTVGGEEVGWNAVEWSLRQGHLTAGWWLYEQFPHLSIGAVSPTKLMQSDPKANANSSTLKLFEVCLAKWKEKASQTEKKALYVLSAELDAVAFTSCLISSKILTNDMEVPEKGSLLHVAARHGSVGVLALLLRCEGFDPNFQPISSGLFAARLGSTPLMAATKGTLLGVSESETEDTEVFKKVVDLLVHAGADLLRRNGFGTSALYLAAFRKDQGARLKILLDRLTVEGDEGDVAETHQVLTDTLAGVLAALLDQTHHLDEQHCKKSVELLVAKGGARLVENIAHQSSWPSLRFELYRNNSTDLCGQRKRRWLRSLFLERFELSRETRIAVMERLYLSETKLSGIVRRTLKRFEKDIREGFLWESGCVDCDFALQCDRALYGFSSSGQNGDDSSCLPTLCRPYTDGPKLEGRRETFSRLMVGCRSGQQVGVRFASLSDVAALLDRVVESEEEWWKMKNSQSIFSEIDPSMQGEGSEKAKAVSAAMVAQARKIRDAHVGAVYWCVERVKPEVKRLYREFLFQAAAAEHPFRASLPDHGAAAATESETVRPPGDAQRQLQGEHIVGRIEEALQAFPPSAEPSAAQSAAGCERSLVTLWGEVTLQGGQMAGGLFNQQGRALGGGAFGGAVGPQGAWTPLQCSEVTNCDKQDAKSPMAPTVSSEIHGGEFSSLPLEGSLVVQSFRSTGTAPPKAELNRRLFQVTGRLVQKVKAKETLWTGTPPLYFPYSVATVSPDGNLREVGGVRPRERERERLKFLAKIVRHSDESQHSLLQPLEEFLSRDQPEDLIRSIPDVPPSHANLLQPIPVLQNTDKKGGLTTSVPSPGITFHFHRPSLSSAAPPNPGQIPRDAPASTRGRERKPSNRNPPAKNDEPQGTSATPTPEFWKSLFSGVALAGGETADQQGGSLFRALTEKSAAPAPPPAPAAAPTSEPVGSAAGGGKSLFSFGGGMTLAGGEMADQQGGSLFRACTERASVSAASSTVAAFPSAAEGGKSLLGFGNSTCQMEVCGEEGQHAAGGPPRQPEAAKLVGPQLFSSAPVTTSTSNDGEKDTCRDGEGPEGSSTSGPVPLSLMTLREKARAMMYESEEEFRGDLTTLWKQCHRLHGDKSSSHYTLAAWTLMKWGNTMLGEEANDSSRLF